MKNNNGITLIALVITIIVLLILAGVSIAMLSGDNSILSQSSKAGQETSVATAKEKVALAVNEAYTEWYAKEYAGDSSATAETSLSGNVDAKLTTLASDLDVTGMSMTYSSGKITLTYDSTGDEYTATVENGTVGDWTE